MQYDKAICRREFLRTSLVAGGFAAAGLARFGRLDCAAGTASPNAAGAPPNFTSQVSLTTGADRADLAFRALTPFKHQLAKAIGNKLVVLKPNNVHIDIPLCATHADTLEGVLEFLRSIGKRDVVIAESPAGGSALDGFANYGYTKFVKKYGVKLVDLDTTEFELMHCINQYELRPHPCRVSKLLLDPNNFVVSVAKFKTHMLVGVTLSLKNIVVGAAIKRDGRSDKPLTHGGSLETYHAINYNLFAMAARLHPQLAVIDGFEGMEGEGPAHGTPVEHKVCVASLDWLAADRVATELMGIDFDKIGYLNYCARIGKMGEAALNRIEIIGPPLQQHIKPYKLPKSWDKLIGWQQPLNLKPEPGQRSQSTEQTVAYGSDSGYC